MSTNGKKPKQKAAFHVRCESELGKWLHQHAKERGISSVPELWRQIAHEYRLQTERSKAAAA